MRLYYKVYLQCCTQHQCPLDINVLSRDAAVNENKQNITPVCERSILYQGFMRLRSICSLLSRWPRVTSAVTSLVNRRPTPTTGLRICPVHFVNEMQAGRNPLPMRFISGANEAQRKWPSNYSVYNFRRCAFRWLRQNLIPSLLVNYVSN